MAAKPIRSYSRGSERQPPSPRISSRARLNESLPEDPVKPLILLLTERLGKMIG